MNYERDEQTGRTYPVLENDEDPDLESLEEHYERTFGCGWYDAIGPDLDQFDHDSSA